MVPCPLLPHYRFNTLVSLRWAMAASECWIFNPFVSTVALCSHRVSQAEHADAGQTAATCRPNRCVSSGYVGRDAGHSSQHPDREFVFDRSGIPHLRCRRRTSEMHHRFAQKRKSWEPRLHCWTLQYAPDSRMSNSCSFPSITLKRFIFLPRCRP